MGTRSRYLIAFGYLLMLVAAGNSVYTVIIGGTLPEAAFDFILLGVSALLIVFVGHWLARSEIDSRYYPRIALWCLGGVGVMFVFLLVRALHPGITNPFSQSTRVVALAVATLAGLGIGIHDANSLTRERELQRERDRFRAVFDESFDAMVIADDEGRYVEVNDAGAELFGVPRDELVGRTIDEFATVWYDFESEWRQFQGGENGRGTFPLVRDDGTERIVEYAASMGVLPGRHLSVLRDVTEQKAAEMALRDSEAKFRTVAQNLDEIVWVATTDPFEYVYINPSFDEIWGVGRELLYDDPDAYRQWVHPDDRQRVEERFARLPADTFDEEFRIVRPDGNHRWLHVRGELAESEDGFGFIVGIGQDVTDRIEYQRKLEASNERLEQFAYAASHDLQEPLRMISSYLTLLERRYGDDLDDEAVEFIDFAVDGAERMAGMIDGLLAYSRVESQGQPFEAIDLETILEDVLTDLQIQIEESDAEITVDALPTVHGDGGQLRQVFQNLLTNAIQYSGDEPPRVHVTAEQTGSTWRIAVRDEGIGIDPEDADRIFEVFQRLHSHDEQAGSGLGLALTKRIVERHGGELWVESEPGKGATFSFTLPAVDALDRPVESALSTRE